MLLPSTDAIIFLLNVPSGPLVSQSVSLSNSPPSTAFRNTRLTFQSPRCWGASFGADTPEASIDESVAEQTAAASATFHSARQRHPGIESAIGALQSGNGLERCRDRGETGFERYLALGILGRNLHVLGRVLIARGNPGCAAGHSQRAA